MKLTAQEHEKVMKAARGVRQRIFLRELLTGAAVNLVEHQPGSRYASAQFRSYERMFARLPAYGLKVEAKRLGPRGGVRWVLEKI